MKPISLILIRHKEKPYEIKFSAAQRQGPVNFLYLSRYADRLLGSPKAIALQIEPAPQQDVHYNAATESPRPEEPSYEDPAGTR